MASYFRAAAITMLFVLLVHPVFSDTSAPASTITAISTSDSSFHVFAPGQPFSFTLTYSGSGVTGYQWVDWRGATIGLPVNVSGLSFTVTSPNNKPLKQGYYGLRLLPEGTVIQPGSRKELGFAVLLKFTRTAPQTSPFGMVHAAMNDPYLQFAWTKTTWTHPFWKWDTASNVGTFDKTGWAASEQHVLDAGKTDLPVISDAPWGLNPANVPGITEFASDVYSGTPNLPAAEWGIEEAHNGWDTAASVKFFENLAVELKAVRAAANSSGATNTKLVQQIEGISEHDPAKVDCTRAFFKSDVLQYVDVLSLHPYAWMDFNSPDTWMDTFLKAIEQARASSIKPSLPIWFTECGCVVDDAGLGPLKMQDGGHPISGLSRADGANYLVKAHVIAFSDGVSRIYWYRYQDWHDDSTNGEEHFGLRDVFGYPKPQYSAYANLVNVIGSKRFVTSSETKDSIHIYTFAGSGTSCIVAWRDSETPSPVQCALSEFATNGKITSITDTIGSELTPTKGKIQIDDSPIFLIATDR